MNKRILGLMMAIVIVSPLFALAQSITIPTDTVTTQALPNYSHTQALALIPTVITWAFGFLLAIVVLMLIASAYLFVTGGGNPEQLGKAKNLLMYALIGLAVALIARGLIFLLISILGV